MSRKLQSVLTIFIVIAYNITKWLYPEIIESIPKNIRAVFLVLFLLYLTYFFYLNALCKNDRKDE